MRILGSLFPSKARCNRVALSNFNLFLTWCMQYFLFMWPYHRIQTWGLLRNGTDSISTDQTEIDMEGFIAAWIQDQTDSRALVIFVHISLHMRDTDSHSWASTRNTTHGNEVLWKDSAYLIHGPWNQRRGSQHDPGENEGSGGFRQHRSGQDWRFFFSRVTEGCGRQTELVARSSVVSLWRYGSRDRGRMHVNTNSAKRVQQLNAFSYWLPKRV